MWYNKVRLQMPYRKVSSTFIQHKHLLSEKTRFHMRFCIKCISANATFRLAYIHTKLKYQVEDKSFIHISSFSEEVSQKLPSLTELNSPKISTRNHILTKHGDKYYFTDYV